MTTTPVNRNRFSPLLVVVPPTILIGALGSSLGGPVASIIGGVAGLIWGILIGFASTLVARRWPKFPSRWLYFGAVIAATLFGGSLFAMLLYVASPTPENILALMRPPWKGGLTFFVIFNSLMEWFVIPVAVFVNWQNPRRRPLLIACAVLFYLSRVWSYIYFVPQIFQFMTVSSGGALSSELAASVVKWVNLSWLRCAFDGVVAVLFLRAASESEQS